MTQTDESHKYAGFRSPREAATVFPLMWAVLAVIPLPTPVTVDIAVIGCGATALFFWQRWGRPRFPLRESTK